MNNEHIDTDYLTECLSRYRQTNNQYYLSEIYKGFRVLVKHNLNVILKRSGIRYSQQDREDVIEDATTRLIMRIIKKNTYEIPSHVWVTKAYWETVKQLYSEHRKHWDRVLSINTNEDEDDDGTNYINEEKDL